MVTIDSEDTLWLRDIRPRLEYGLNVQEIAREIVIDEAWLEDIIDRYSAPPVVAVCAEDDAQNRTDVGPLTARASASSLSAWLREVGKKCSQTAILIEQCLRG